MRTTLFIFLLFVCHSLFAQQNYDLKDTVNLRFKEVKIRQLSCFQNGTIIIKNKTDLDSLFKLCNQKLTFFNLYTNCSHAILGYSGLLGGLYTSLTPKIYYIKSNNTVVLDLTINEDIYAIAKVRRGLYRIKKPNYYNCNYMVIVKVKKQLF